MRGLRTELELSSYRRFAEPTLRHDPLRFLMLTGPAIGRWRRFRIKSPRDCEEKASRLPMMKTHALKSVLFLAACWACRPTVLAEAAPGSLPTVRPEEVGLSSDHLQDIGVTMRRLMAEHKIPGGVALIARQGKVAYCEAFGEMDLETGTAMRSDAIFRMASMSKPPVSVAAMILWEKGKFQLDDPVSKFIPEFKGLKVFKPGGRAGWSEPSREMTIEDLLRHTSGLFSSPTGPQEFVDLYQAAKLGDRSGTLQDLIAKLSRLPLAASPGEQWVYSRSTDVLGRLIEVVSGKTLDLALRELVFEPLAMADTGFYVPPESQPRLARNHKITEAGALVVAGKPGKDPPLERPTMFSASGGLVSTATDYFRFAQMLLNKGELDGVRLLRPKTVELMTNNRVPPQAMPLSMHDPAFDWMVKGCGFGLGFRVIVDPGSAEPTASVGSYGWFGANDTFFLIDPKEQLVGIFLAQVSLSARTPYPGVREFQSLMYQSIVH